MFRRGGVGWGVGVGGGVGGGGGGGGGQLHDVSNRPNPLSQ